MRLMSQPLPLGPADGRLTSREWIVLVLGALTLTVLVCLAEPSIFGAIDWVRLHVFYKPYIRASVLRGHLPLWNPYVSLGRPLLAEPDSAFFYPPELAYLLLDEHLACLIVCALHLLLCLYGMVKLARAIGVEKKLSFAVAFVFACSAPVAGCFTSGYIHYGPAICFIPLVLYLGMRLQATPNLRSMAIMALVFGLLHMCGHPQAAWLTSIGVSVFMAGRRLERAWRSALAGLVRDMGWLALAMGLGAALAAVCLLPLAELAGQSNRQGASLAFSGAFAEPAFGWATLLVPSDIRYFHFQANAQLYAGIAACVLGVCGLLCLRNRNMRALLILTVFAALLAAGNATPFFKLFFHTLPGLSAFRLHSRATIFVTLSLVLGAGFFLSRPSPRPRADAFTVLIAGVLALCVGWAFVLAWPGYGGHGLAEAAVRAALIAGTAALCLLYVLPARSVRGRRVLELALAGLLAFDLGSAVWALKQQNRDYADAAKESAVWRGLVGSGHFPSSGVPPRIFIPGFRENAGMLLGWSSPYGYVSLTLGRVWNAMHDGLGIAAPVALNTFPSTEIAKFGPFPYASMALVLGVDPATHRLAVNPAPDPRVYLAGSSRLVRDDREATSLMHAGHDFHHIALVEKPLELPTAPSSRAGSVAITRFEPERISVAVETSAPALLVLAEPWYPGWSALVNGLSAPCIPANAWMRAVPVPAGKSQVVLTFHSTYLVSGAVISLATLALVVFLLVRRRTAVETPQSRNPQGGSSNHVASRPVFQSVTSAAPASTAGEVAASTPGF